MKKVILVGTETGNSLDYANRLSEDLERLNGEEVEIFLMDEFKLNCLLDEELETIIFICSTTGDGEEPANMRQFMKFLLRADLPSDLFVGMKFCVFGLGDSSYDKFNFVGKRVYRRMQQLGGKDLVGFRGEGDERHPFGIDFGWNIWWQVLKTKLSITNPPKYQELDPLPPRCTLNIKASSSTTLDCTDKFYKCKLVECIRVTPNDHFQDTRLLRIKTSDETPSIKPGDILNLKPTNEPEIVETLINLMNWDENELIYGIDGEFSRIWLQAIKSDEFPMTLKTFLVRHVDLSRIPSKSTLRTLACLSDKEAADYSPMHQEKLIELSREEGEYLDYIWRPKRTILEILKDFQPTVKIDQSRILQVFQPIKPRQFSIANYSFADGGGGIIELLIALVKEDLPLGRGFREGLCSKWIREGRIFNDLTHVTLSHGSLNPEAIKSKIFLFAAGTGIAPLRSLIQSLANQRDREIVLYFGCRMIGKDFYFKDEWIHYDNLTVFVAGSRDSSGSRVYLDDIIKANSGPLVSINDPTDITCIVTGHSRLNKLVQDTLIQVWGENNGKSWLDWLKSHGQFQTETWS